MTSGTDYFAASKISGTDNSRKRKYWLQFSVGLNLLVLGVFKYYNFFSASLVELLQTLGFHASHSSLQLILPVGISFYTFQSIAYVTDVYRNKVAAESSPVNYFAFICFFPQMVAGPIELAKRMLPQFRAQKKLSWQYVESGVNLLLYGLFKKVVIADNLALFVDQVHKDYAIENSIYLLLGVFAFAVQIYADFSGYTDIARGCARLLGFRLSRNFYYPYFSKSFSEFWRRWHMSLSAWFKNYVYISLGGNKVSQSKRDRNLLITFTLSGLWHGANFTFLVWGFFHGLLLVIEKRLGLDKKPVFVWAALVFILVSILFTLFRADSMQHFLGYMQCMLKANSGNAAFISPVESSVFIALPILFFVFVETCNVKGMRKYRVQLNYAMAAVVLMFIALYGVFENAPSFIYFQF